MKDLKTPRILKLEIISLLLGLIGSSVFLAVITFWQSIPVEIREAFRGGQIGAQISGGFIVIGFLGTLVLSVNLIRGIRNYWWARILGYVIFLALSISIGANM